MIFTVRQKQTTTLTWEEVQEVLGRAWPRKTFHLHDVHLLLLLFWIILIGRQRWVIIFTRASCLEDKLYNQLFKQQTCWSSHKDGYTNVKLTNKKGTRKRCILNILQNAMLWFYLICRHLNCADFKVFHLSEVTPCNVLFCCVLDDDNLFTVLDFEWWNMPCNSHREQFTVLSVKVRLPYYSCALSLYLWGIWLLTECFP